MQPNEIGNSEAATEKETMYFDGMKIKISDLLNDLKSNNHIEKPTKNQIDALLKIIGMEDTYSKIYNTLNEIIEKKDTTDQFFDGSEITKYSFPYLFVFTTIGVFNRQTEGFKLLFLMMLKASSKSHNKMTLGQLCVELNKKSELASAVTDELELALRNVFAHQTYWFEGGEIHYSEDATFQNIKRLDLVTLLMKAKKQNIILQALLRVFAEKINSGFFSDS